MKPARKRLIRIALKIITFGGSSAFALAATAPLWRSTDQFKPLPGEARVCYELGAENAASTVARALPASLAAIERAQLHPFAKPVTIYVCARTATFDRYGFGVSGAGGFVLNGRLFISPKPQNTAERLPRLLTHELSHLHLEQRLGLLRYAGDLPGWFKEGLAVHVSGAGAETVPETEARDAIVNHQLFKPVTTGSLIFPQTGSREGLKVHLFYRESAMFVGYLAHRDPAAFEQLLNALAAHQPFAESLRRAYSHDAAALQVEFAAEINTTAVPP